MNRNLAIGASDVGIGAADVDPPIVVHASKVNFDSVWKGHVGENGVNPEFRQMRAGGGYYARIGAQQDNVIYSIYRGRSHVIHLKGLNA